MLDSTASPILVRPDRAHLLFICSTCASALARARTKASSEFTSCDKEHCIVYNAPAREVNRQGKSKAIAIPRSPPATISKYLNRQPRQGATYCYLLA
jgi:hypothetical protein